MGSANPDSIPSLEGKSILVTGGLSGIGLAMVKFFASTPSTTISILDISPTHSGPVLSTLRTSFPSTTFHFHTCDISSWSAQAAVFKEVHRLAGRIDIVCANAGVTEVGKLDGRGEVDGDGEPREPNLKTLDVNLTGTIYSIRLATHYMRKNEGPKRGMIVCTASNAGLYPFPIAPLYAISKHAVVGAVRSLARNLEGDGIRINGLAPNCIATGLADDKLFSVMTITPMETLISAVRDFVKKEDMNGVIAEISGPKYTVREPPEYSDQISRENIEAFWTLGYA